MELIERNKFLAALEGVFEKIVEGEGHCILLAGEAGIGKTSLIKAFSKQKKNDCNIYQGTCDSLFTPRPLAPLYDIIGQINNDLWPNDDQAVDRVKMFSKLFNELRNQDKPTLVIFEDIHWADEATLDFIKFFARRIAQIRCLFIISYRDNEVNAQYPLRNLLGQLPSDSFTTLQLLPLSRQAVEALASEKGYSGEDVYSISGGNPFYVNEILASYSPGIPENIKDSILALYNTLDDKIKGVWSALSVIPAGFEVAYLERMEPEYETVIENCLLAKIIVLDNGVIFFKHELYRRTIEASLSPVLRVALNKRILDLFLEDFEQNQEIERIIHHAKNANEHQLVIKYAPLAAGQAAAVGAHIESARLYYMAISCYNGDDKDVLAKLYEPYAYECYLTNQLKEAIAYQEKLLAIRQEQDDKEQMGNSFRFLSRLWWFEGNHKQSEHYAYRAIKALGEHSSSKATAMAFSNMSQLKMLSDQNALSIFWGEKAITLAKELKDDETLSHALNNVGSAYLKVPASKQQGIDMLMKSLEIALKKSYHEHAARAYINLIGNSIILKDYEFAEKASEEGIQYCMDRDLDSWAAYMLSCKARLLLETGNWEQAYAIADKLLANKSYTSIVIIPALTVIATIKMRRGDTDALPLLLEASDLAFEAMELQRIIPVLAALLEYEWLTGERVVEKEMFESALNLLTDTDAEHYKQEFDFWVTKVQKNNYQAKVFYDAYKISDTKAKVKSVAPSEESGCRYAHAIKLFDGGIADKKMAINIIHGLGANRVYEKMKADMRTSGIKNIPRGMRKSTLENPANLTRRELDILFLLKEGLQNKEIAERLFISAKTVDHHISSILFKLDAKSRAKAVTEAVRLEIIK
jgi:ATP/maltotriose-dependent transcriptional regulator MalT